MDTDKVISYIIGFSIAIVIVAGMLAMGAIIGMALWM